MEPKKIKRLKTWWNWIKKNPLKASVFFVFLIIVVVGTGFLNEKGRQLAEPTSPLKSPTPPNMGEQVAFDQEGASRTAQTHFGSGDNVAGDKNVYNESKQPFRDVQVVDNIDLDLFINLDGLGRLYFASGKIGYVMLMLDTVPIRNPNPSGISGIDRATNEDFYYFDTGRNKKKQISVVNKTKTFQVALTKIEEVGPATEHPKIDREIRYTFAIAEVQ